MASRGKEQVVIPRWQPGKLVLEHLWDFYCPLALSSNASLDFFWEDLVW